jgi:tripartite-type tricarboxylate transporter receptor subunit TctC
MVVPFAAGGPTDTYARIVAEQLSAMWGQQLVIHNKGGAGSNIGNAFVAHSGPDGYTLLYGTSSLAANGAGGGCDILAMTDSPRPPLANNKEMQVRPERARC